MYRQYTCTEGVQATEQTLAVCRAEGVLPCHKRPGQPEIKEASIVVSRQIHALFRDVTSHIENKNVALLVHMASAYTISSWSAYTELIVKCIRRTCGNEHGDPTDT